MHVLSISESAIISLLTSRIGTDSWHLFSKKSSSDYADIFLFIPKSPTKKPQNWRDFLMKCFFQQLWSLLLFFKGGACRCRCHTWPYCSAGILYMQYVWIDSFFELRCFGAMLWFPVQLDSWWSSISFSRRPRTKTLYVPWDLWWKSTCFYFCSGRGRCSALLLSLFS
jgi:hypothetical protein